MYKQIRKLHLKLHLKKIIISKTYAKKLKQLLLKVLKNKVYEHFFLS